MDAKPLAARRVLPSLLAALGWTTAALAAPALDGTTLRSGRLQIAVAPTALPAQVTIAPEPAELPLDLRAADTLPPERLLAIGRGPQLREPFRLEALVKDQVQVAAVAGAPAAPALADGVVNAAAELQAGALRFGVRARYGDGGLLTLTVTPRGAPAVDGLRLVLPLAGPVDLLIPLLSAGGAPQGAPHGAFTPAAHEGVVWSNTTGNGGERVLAAPGIVQHLFAGSGDRGISVRIPDAAAWPVDPAQPTAQLLRDKTGQLELHLWLANRTATLAEKTPFELILQFLPAAPSRDPGGRLARWQPPAAGAQLAAELLRAPPRPGLILVEGPAGGDALSREATLADSCPIELFRYLAGCPAGQPAQVRSNAATLVRPGQSPAVDRMVLGRALLHDAGLDPRTLAHRTLGLRALAALERLGLLGATAADAEFLPYWRSAEIVRYGERFEAGGAFETDAENPVGRAYVSAYIRRAPGGKGEREALFIVVNESDKPLREQFYLLQPAYLFGGPNRATAAALIADWNLDAIPAESDWNRAKLSDSAVRASRSQDAGRPASTAELYDLEDRGWVDQASAKDGLEVYGPLFVPARGYRLLYGSGLAASARK